MRYSETLLDHFLHPRHAGLMRDPDAVGQGAYEGCGDLARMFVRVSRGCITEVRFQAYGCGATIAAASLASELMVGRAVGDLLHLKAEEIEQALDGLPADRRHAADVVAEALRAVARDWRRREDHGV